MSAETADVLSDVDSTVWVPPVQVCRHNGEPITEDADFAMPPPAEIGDVLTAATTLRRGIEPRSLLSRVTLILVVCAAIYLVTDGVLVLLLRPVQPWTAFRVAIGILIVFTALIIWLATGFKHVISYVGARGIVRYVLRRTRDGLRRTDLFRFDEAAELRVSTVNHYHNGIYAGTHYSFQWTDSEGRRVFRLKGSHNSKHGTPKPKHEYWYARAAERAWTLHAWQRAQEEFGRDGCLTFQVDPKRRLRVGKGWLEIQWKDQTYRLTPADLKRCDMTDGSLVIHTHDAKWFSTQGKFTIAASKLPNVQVFATAMEELFYAPPE